MTVSVNRYLTVSVYSTSVFACTTLADGQVVLVVYPSMVCYSTQHNMYMALGTLGVVVYMVGFPVGVGAALSYMHYRGLHTDSDFIEVLGWIYGPFEAKVFATAY